MHDIVIRGGTILDGRADSRAAYDTCGRPQHNARLRDGIGKWTEAEIVTALRNGTRPSLRHLHLT